MHRVERVEPVWIELDTSLVLGEEDDLEMTNDELRCLTRSETQLKLLFFPRCEASNRIIVQ